MLEFFDQLLGGERVAISEMKDKVPEHSEVWRGRWERMTEKLDDADSGALAWDRDLRWTKLVVALVAAVLLGVVVLCDLSVNEEWFAPAAVGAVTLIAILAVPGDRLRRLDPEHRERAARWQSFARWTEDFPRLSDDPPATLALWKRILVYGVAFGTAERMISSGRIPEPVVASASRTAARLGAYAFTGSFDGVVVRRLELQLVVRLAGRPAELVERRRGRLLGRRRRLLGRRRGRLVVRRYS